MGRKVRIIQICSGGCRRVFNLFWPIVPGSMEEVRVKNNVDF